MIQQVFLRRVAVEPGDGAQAPGEGGPGAAAGFQVMGEAFNISAVRLEQVQVVLLAPGRELAQVQLVRFAGQAAIAGQEPANAIRSVLVNTGATGTRAADGAMVIGYLPGLAETREAGPAEASATM